MTLSILNTRHNTSKSVNYEVPATEATVQWKEPESKKKLHSYAKYNIFCIK